MHYMPWQNNTACKYKDMNDRPIIYPEIYAFLRDKKTKKEIFLLFLSKTCINFVVKWSEINRLGNVLHREHTINRIMSTLFSI